MQGALINKVGMVGYALTALAYMLLATILIRGEGRRPLRQWLLAACVITAGWATLAAIYFNREATSSGLLLLELGHMGLWLYILFALVRSGLSRRVRFVGYLLSVIAGAILVAIVIDKWITGESSLWTFSAGNKLGLLAALSGLILTEQLYRNSSLSTRKSLRPFVVALGICFVYDLFYYAQAEMLNVQTLETWALRPISLLIAAPLFMVTLRRSDIWMVDIFVSRQVVFYSTSFVAVGAYLLLMALGGIYLQQFGAHWLLPLDGVFIVFAGVVLGWLLSSAKLRRELRVFIAKHFYRNKYDYRIQWLNFIATLSNGARDNVYRTSVQAIAQVIESPGGVFFARDEVQKRFIPVAVWPRLLVDAESLSDLPSNSELVAFLERKSWVIDLREYAQDPNLYDNFQIPAQLALSQGFRIISPILEMGQLTGFLALHSPPEPFELTFEDRDLLKTVGSHVATYVAQRRADDQLLANRQFEAFNRLVAFAMHDLKNSVAQLQLVSGNARKHRHNPEFVDDVLATVENVSQRVMALIEQISRRRDSGQLEAHDCRQLVATAVAQCADRRPVPVVNLTHEEAQVACDGNQFLSAIEHLIRNAQDATAPTGDIEITLQRVSGGLELIVKDTGIGMTQEFIRERLFNPFDSTKGAKGMGIGAYQVRECVLKMGGELSVSSVPGRGTCFSIRLPLSAAPIGVMANGARQRNVVRTGQ